MNSIDRSRKKKSHARMSGKHVSNGRKEALRGLLDDPSPVVQNALKSEFKRLGEPGRHFLQEVASDTTGEVQSRARAYLEELFGPDPSKVILEFIWNLSYELETGLIMLHLAIDPDVEASAIRSGLDSLASRCRDLLIEPGDPVEVCRVINRVLFHETGFRGTLRDQADPLASCIGEVLKGKRGSSILLSSIYVLVAQRLKLDLELIALPEEVMVGCFKAEWPVYIDPLRAGKIHALEDMHELLLSMDTEPEIQYLAPSPVGEVLYKVCLEQVDIFKHRDQPELADMFEQFIRAFEKSHSL